MYMYTYYTPIDRWTDRQTNRQTNRSDCGSARCILYTYGYMDRQTDRQTEMIATQQVHVYHTCSSIVQYPQVKLWSTTIVGCCTIVPDGQHFSVTLKTPQGSNMTLSAILLAPFPVRTSHNSAAYTFHNPATQLLRFLVAIETLLEAGSTNTVTAVGWHLCGLADRDHSYWSAWETSLITRVAGWSEIFSLALLYNNYGNNQTEDWCKEWHIPQHSWLHHFTQPFLHK